MKNNIYRKYRWIDRELQFATPKEVRETHNGVLENALDEQRKDCAESIFAAYKLFRKELEQKSIFLLGTMEAWDVFEKELKKKYLGE